MRQVVITRHGDPSVLQVQEHPDPEPGPNEVRVRVGAAGVNFADLQARMGMYPAAPPPPFVVGYEVAGRVDAVGEGADASLVGTDVIAMTIFGGYTDTVVLPEMNVVRRPDGLDPVTAAAIPVAYLTAWMMVEEMGRVRPGDRVLVHSAGGGVGLAAQDLLARRGAYTIGTASAGKHAFLAERGYDQLIDYRTEDFEEALAGEPGLDLVLDPIGSDYWAKDLRLLRAAGKLVCFGLSRMAQSDSRNLLNVLRAVWGIPWRKTNPIALMNANKAVMGVNMLNMKDEPDRVVEWLHALMALWSEGVLRPVVHATVPFAEAPEAHRMLHDRENTGKVVLVPGEA